MGIYLPERRDQYSFHLSIFIDVRAKVFAPIQPRTNTVLLSWYTGKGGRLGLIISWDPLAGKYTTWLLS